MNQKLYRLCWTASRPLTTFKLFPIIELPTHAHTCTHPHMKLRYEVPATSGCEYYNYIHRPAVPLSLILRMILVLTSDGFYTASDEF